MVKPVFKGTTELGKCVCQKPRKAHGVCLAPLISTLIVRHLRFRLVKSKNGPRPQLLDKVKILAKAPLSVY